MTATFDSKEHEINANHRKENKYTGSFLGIVFEKERFETIVDLRFYWTDSRCYACVWIHDKKTLTWTGGSGFAGGYGYHKESAAASSAFEAAGITLDENINGVGTSAIEEVVETICKALRPEAAIYVTRCHA